MSVYDGYLTTESAGSQQFGTLGVVLTKNPLHNTFSAAISFTNTGDLNWTFGVGLSIMDSAGNQYNCWSNNILSTLASGALIDSQYAAMGATVTRTISNIPLNVGGTPLATGTLQFIVNIWKESAVPVSTVLSRYPATGWATTDSNGNSLSIVQLQPGATITTVVLA